MSVPVDHTSSAPPASVRMGAGIGPALRMGMIILPLGFGIGIPLFVPPAQPAWSAGTIAIITVSCVLGSALFLLVLFAISSRPFIIDLAHGVIRTRSRRIPFADVTRLSAFRASIVGGSNWILLGTAQKHPVQRAAINWGARGAFKIEHWRALQHLVTYSGIPGLEVLRPDGVRREEPLAVVPRERLLATLEDQCVWVLAGSRGGYESSPFHRLIRDAP